MTECDTLLSRVNEREMKDMKTAFQNAANKFGLSEERKQSVDSNSSLSSAARENRKISVDSYSLKVRSGSISSPLKWKKNSESKWIPDEPNSEPSTPVFNNNIRRISLQPKQIVTSARLLSRRVSNESYFGSSNLAKNSSIDLLILKKDSFGVKKTTSESMFYSSKENLKINISKEDDNDDDTSTITSESLSEKHCIKDDDSSRFIEYDDTDSLFEKPKEV